MTLSERLANTADWLKHEGYEDDHVRSAAAIIEAAERWQAMSQEIAERGTAVIPSDMGLAHAEIELAAALAGFCGKIVDK